MAILDHSFVDMADVLKPLFCATVVLGHHIMCPFQRLLVDVDTTYETLLTAFLKFYQELLADPASFFILNKYCFFVPEKMFKEALAKYHILYFLFNTCKEYEEEIVKIKKYVF